MNREYIEWHSPKLDRTMELLIFGHGGVPILAFPSSMGRFYEWEDVGMVDALAPQLEGGLNQLVCVDSVDGESFYNEAAAPLVRVERHRQYEQYVFDEVLPFVHRRAGPFVIAAGTNFGAYHALNVVLKQPWRFGKLIAMSGTFDVSTYLDGFYADEVYFSNPVDYLPNLDDVDVLDALRRSRIVLTTAEYDPSKDANLRLSRLFDAKGIAHTLDVQPGVFGHDWPWWRELISRYVP